MQLLLAYPSYPVHKGLVAGQGIRRAHDLHLAGAAVHLRRSLNDVLCIFFHILVDFCGLSADLDLHLCHIRDHVPAASSHNGSHIDPAHSSGVPRDPVQV